MPYQNLKHRIDVAAGRKPADLLIKNARVVSVLADCICKTHVAISNGVIVGFGNYKAKKVLDIRGGYLSAGLIDGHIHIESTLLSPAEFARTVVPRGTTSVVADPHEIANVLGESGIKWMIEASRDLPLDVNIVLPSCVPASKFETSATTLHAAQLKKLVNLPNVIGIGEVMNYPAVIRGDLDILKKIRLIPGMRVDGHAPSLSGKELYAYIAAGIYSDHESTKADEALEKLIAGLHIMIREGSNEKNLKELIKIITPANAQRCFFCSDDKTPMDLVKHGHIDHSLRLAVRSGMDPLIALQMATNNAPHYFRLKRRLGAVAVGYAADLVVFDDLKNFNARLVFKNGKLVAKNGKLLVSCSSKNSAKISNTVNFKKLNSSSFEVKDRKHPVRVIKLVHEQITTKEEVVRLNSDNGLLHADLKRDILKIAVVERHHASGNIAVGFVKGFSLKRGAIASTVCHDSHNVITVGTNDDDMIVACNVLKKCGGGFVSVENGRVTAILELPIAGLMSDKRAEEVSVQYAKLESTTKKMGSKIKNPFFALSFLALSVVPDIRITDQGIIDSKNGKIVGLYA